MRPLCATEDTSSTILGEREIHANDCEIVSEQEINENEILATGESLRPPFATKGTSYAMLSRLELDNIETVTVGQPQNEAWKTHRRGKISASNYYRVFTKVETMKNQTKKGAQKQKPKN